MNELEACGYLLDLRERQLATCTKTMREVSERLLTLAPLAGEYGGIGEHELIDLADRLSSARAGKAAV